MSTRRMQRGPGECGGATSQFRVIQPRGTADSCNFIPSSGWCVPCAGRFCSASSLLVFSPLTVRMNVLQLDGAAGQQDAGGPTKSFLFLPG